MRNPKFSALRELAFEQGETGSKNKRGKLIDESILEVKQKPGPGVLHTGWGGVWTEYPSKLDSLLARVF